MCVLVDAIVDDFSRRSGGAWGPDRHQPSAGCERWSYATRAWWSRNDKHDERPNQFGWVVLTFYGEGNRTKMPLALNGEGRHKLERLFRCSWPRPRP